MSDIATSPPAAGPRRGARVLLVEDDLLNREVALGMLSPLGLHVTLAGDGAEAVRLATSASFDLILMDILMPVMDGLTAARAIRAIPGRADIPIIAMSANIHPEDRRRSREAGLDAHLSKPVDPDQLCRELARWLPADGSAEPAGSEFPEPSAAMPVTHHGVIDVAIGLQFFGGREDAYLRMLQRFMTLRSGDAALVRAAIAEGDNALAGRLAHSVKSMAATLGADQLRVASAHLERLTAEGDAAAITAAVLVFEQALQRACEAISVLVAAANQSRSDG